MRKIKRLIDRFEKSFRKDPSGCWNWTKYVMPEGYGQIQEQNYHGKIAKVTRAHRVSWMLYRGKIPKGLWVLHKCDNPRCVNPDHLFLGTHQDNMDDMARKGRRVIQYGEKANRAKLTEEDVLEIRKDKRSYHKIAQDYGVGDTTIRMAKIRKTWTHI